LTIPVIAGYAPNGDILSANDSANGNWTYTYDDFNRLLTANATGQAYTYDYDRYGNRWHQNGPHSSQLAFDANNHISGVTGVGYDASGDTTGDATTTYTYDAEGRISSSSNSSNGLWCNTYNAEGQRVRKTNVTQGTCAAPTQSNSWDFLYDLSAHEIAMISGTGVWDRGEVYVGARRVATYNNGTTYFIHTDQLGTDRVRTTISGSVYQACNNLPFGDNFSCPGSDATPMHFTGKNHVYESGLDDFGARYLTSSMGRFMTPDWSAKPQGVPYAILDDPQSLNLYTYVRNNPLNRTDPSGHYICTGTKPQCQAVADALIKARAALESKDLSKEQRAALNKVVSTFGKAGDEHDGVTISIGKTQSKKAIAEAHSHKDENGLLRTDITFNSKGFGSLNTTEVAGTLVHERSHGIDGIANGNMDPQTKKQEFASELRAYNVESYVPKGLGVSFPGLWNPNWAADSAEASRFTGVFTGAIASTSDWCGRSGAPGC
jgi:RHS repeat-associated protein